MCERLQINTNDRHFYNVLYSALNQRKIPVFTPSIPPELVGVQLNSKLPLQTLETATTPQEAFLKPYCEHLHNKCLYIGNFLINSLEWEVSYQKNPHQDSQPKAIFEPIGPIEPIPEFIEIIPEPSAEWFEGGYEPTYEEVAELGELFPEVDTFFEDYFLDNEVIVENGEEVIIYEDLIVLEDNIVIGEEVFVDYFLDSEVIVENGEESIIVPDDLIVLEDNIVIEEDANNLTLEDFNCEFIEKNPDILTEPEVIVNDENTEVLEENQIVDEENIQVVDESYNQEKILEQAEENFGNIKEEWERYDFTDKTTEEVNEIKEIFQNKIDDIKQRMLNDGVPMSEIEGRNFSITVHKIDGFNIIWNGKENYMESISDIRIIGGREGFSFVKSANESGRIKILDEIPTIDKQGNINDRIHDTEFVTLDETLYQLADKLEAKFDETTGDILIYTEKEPCISCQNGRNQVQKYYPNIKITFLDGKGKIS